MRAFVSGRGHRPAPNRHTALGILALISLLIVVSVTAAAPDGICHLFSIMLEITCIERPTLTARTRGMYDTKCRMPHALIAKFLREQNLKLLKVIRRKAGQVQGVFPKLLKGNEQSCFVPASSKKHERSDY